MTDIMRIGLGLAGRWPHATALIAIAMTAATLLPAQSTPAPHPAFDVVSIQPDPAPPGQTAFQEFRTKPAVRASGNKFEQTRITLRDLIMEAYGVWDYQISGLPAWAQAPGGERYDVDAGMEGNKTLPADQLQSMVQSLLADRFHLRLHRETRQLAVFALAIAKSGPKFQAVPESMRGMTVPDLIRLLTRVVDLPIIDKTGLPGTYDFAQANALDWRQLGEEHKANPQSAPESLIWALEDKLGLKLEPGKEPVEVLVIDQAEKPTPN